MMDINKEREAFEDATSTIDPSEVRRLDGFREGWEAYAAQQRTQSAGVPLTYLNPLLPRCTYSGACRVKALDLALLLCSGATTSTSATSFSALYSATIPGAV